MRIHRITAKQFHQRTIRDATHNFEFVETTISHSLRQPSPVLSGRTYGEAMYQALGRWRILDRPSQVLEVGGGAGDVAAGIIAAADPALDAYTIVDLSPGLANGQRQRLAGSNPAVRHIHGDIETIGPDALPAAPFSGLVLANEMLADLDTWRITSTNAERKHYCASADIDIAPASREALNPRAVNDLFDRLDFWPLIQYRQTFFPAGLVRMFETLHKLVADDAAVIFTEYFSMQDGGGLVNLGGHQECALNLDIVCALARRTGFSVQTWDLVDFLDMRLDRPTADSRYLAFCADKLDPEISNTLLVAPGEDPVRPGIAPGNQHDFYGRGQFMNFVSQFYALVLRKRRVLDAQAVDLEFVPRRNPAVARLSNNAGGDYLFCNRPYAYEGINATGAFIWDAIDGRASLDTIARRLAQAFKVELNAARDDVLAFARVLIGRDNLD